MVDINKRLTLKLTFIISILALASAFFIEHALGHQPCNLCILERIPYLMAIIIIVLNYKFIHLEKYFILLLILVFFSCNCFNISSLHTKSDPFFKSQTNDSSMKPCSIPR